MGNQPSHHAQAEFPANSPASTMAGLHGPEINYWSQTWQTETQRRNLATWPLLGSFQDDKLEAVRTVLTKYPVPARELAKQLSAFTLWAEQGRLEYKHKQLKAQQHLERKLEMRNAEQRKLKDDADLKSPSSLYPVRPSSLSAPPVDILDYPVAPPSYSGLPEHVPALPSAPPALAPSATPAVASEPISAPAPNAHFLAEPLSEPPSVKPRARPVLHQPVEPNNRQERAFRRLTENLTYCLPDSSQTPRLGVFKKAKGMMVQSYKECERDIKVAKDYLSTLNDTPVVKTLDVLEYLVDKARAERREGSDTSEDEDERIYIAPLRTVPAPEQFTLATVHQPWTPQEILGLRPTFPPLRSDPKKFVSTLRDVLVTYRPTLPDLRQLLRVTLTEDQLATIVTKADWDLTSDLRDVAAKREGEVETAANPLLTNKIEQIVKAIEGLCTPLTDFEKIKSCKQQKAEDVADFLQRVKKAYVQYSGMADPVNNARSLVITQFVDGLHPKASADIKRMCVGWEGLSYDGIVAHARHYCNLYCRKEEETKERLMNLQVETLEQQKEANAIAPPVAPDLSELALQMVHQMNRYQGPYRGPGGGPGRPQYQPSGPQQAPAASQLFPPPHNPEFTALARDQCSYCKQIGHWKFQCPNRPPRAPYSRPPAQYYGSAPGSYTPAPPLQFAQAAPVQTQSQPVSRPLPVYPYDTYPPPLGQPAPSSLPPAQQSSAVMPVQALQAIPANGSSGIPALFQE